jgi:hypothetical protein
VKLKFNVNINKKRSEIALLRIAYLLAFSKLGNGFLINGGLYKIREQLLNPDKEIIPRVFWIKYEFPKEIEGVNIITLPKELQCYLVVFYLTTPSITRQFAIALPGPSKSGLKVYDFINQRLCQGDGSSALDLSIEHIPNIDYLRKKEYTFVGNEFWDEYTKDDYRPR